MSRKKREPAAQLPPFQNARDVGPLDPSPVDSQASLVVTILAAPAEGAARKMIVSVQDDSRFRTNEARGVVESLVRTLHSFEHKGGPPDAGPAAPQGEGPPCADPTPSTPG